MSNNNLLSIINSLSSSSLLISEVIASWVSHGSPEHDTGPFVAPPFSAVVEGILRSLNCPLETSGGIMEGSWEQGSAGQGSIRHHDLSPAPPRW